MTTLENSYCVPRTVEEWSLCLNGDIPSMINQTHIAFFHAGELSSANENGFWWKDRKDGKTEIPVPHFIDLLHDRIVPWRLEEIGFNNPLGDTYKLRLSHDWDDVIVTRMIRVIGGRVSVNGDDVNVATFADLLTLIRLLTPPSK